MANEVQDQPAEAFDEVEIIDEKGQAIITQAAQRQDAEQEVQSRDQRAAQRQDAEKYKIERSGSKFNLLEEKTSGIFKKETKFVPTGRSVNLVNNKVNPDNADFKNVRDVEIKLSEKGILGGKNAGPVTVKLALSTADGKVDPNQKLCIKFNKENKPESMMMGDKDLDLAKVRFNGKLAYLVDDQGNPSHSIPLNSDKFLDYYLQANEIDLGKDKKKFLNEFKEEFKDEFSLEEIKVAAAAVSSGETLSEMVNSIKEKRVRVAGGQGAESVADAQMDTAAPEKPTIAADQDSAQAAAAAVAAAVGGETASQAVEDSEKKGAAEASTAGSVGGGDAAQSSSVTAAAAVAVVVGDIERDGLAQGSDTPAAAAQSDAASVAPSASQDAEVDAHDRSPNSIRRSRSASAFRRAGGRIPSDEESQQATVQGEAREQEKGAAPAEVSSDKDKAHEQGAASPAQGRPVSPSSTPPREGTPSREGTGRGGPVK